MKKRLIILLAAALTMFSFAAEDNVRATAKSHQKEDATFSSTNKVRIVLMSADEWEKAKKHVDTHGHYEFERQKVHLWVTNGLDDVLVPRFIVPRDALNGRRGDGRKKKPVPPHPQPYAGQSY